MRPPEPGSPANLLIRQQKIVTDTLLALRVAPDGCALTLESEPFRIVMLLDRHGARALAKHLLAIADGVPVAPPVVITEKPEGT